MLATAGLNASLLGLLLEQACSADWVVLVGPLPPPLELELEQLVAAVSPGVPLLLVEPDPQRLERLQRDLETGVPASLTLVSALLAAETGEQCWYSYNDPRHSGTIPPEVLQSRLPNLQLESLELRPALPLSAVVERWHDDLREQGKPVADDHGLLLLPLPEATAVLAGAGPWLEQLSTVLLHGPAADGLPPDLEDQLVAACLQAEAIDPEMQLWRGSELLRLRKQLAQLKADHVSRAQQLQELTYHCTQLGNERDHLVGERDQLVSQKAELEQRLELINQELDAILLLLDSAKTEPTAVDAPAAPSAEAARQGGPPQE